MSPTRKTRRSYQRVIEGSTRRFVASAALVGLAGALPILLSLVAAAGPPGAEAPRDQDAIGLPPADPRFATLGSEQCRTCHRSLYEAWREGPHARAGGLLSFEQSLDPQCQPCHVPHADALEVAVGCEACHGAGSAYAELDVMIDPFKRSAAGLVDPATRCASCHNPGHPFHVERDLAGAARGIHPGTGRRRP